MVPAPSDQRTVQEWIAGVEDLERLGLLRARSGSQHTKVFEVTREGYAPAGGLRFSHLDDQKAK